MFTTCMVKSIEKPKEPPPSHMCASEHDFSDVVLASRGGTAVCGTSCASDAREHEQGRYERSSWHERSLRTLLVRKGIATKEARS